MLKNTDESTNKQYRTLALRNSAESKQRLNLENVANASGTDHPHPLTSPDVQRGRDLEAVGERQQAGTTMPQR